MRQLERSCRCWRKAWLKFWLKLAARCHYLPTTSAQQQHAVARCGVDLVYVAAVVDVVVSASVVVVVVAAVAADMVATDCYDFEFEFAVGYQLPLSSSQ